MTHRLRTNLLSVAWIAWAALFCLLISYFKHVGLLLFIVLGIPFASRRQRDGFVTGAWFLMAAGMIAWTIPTIPGLYPSFERLTVVTGHLSGVTEGWKDDKGLLKLALKTSSGVREFAYSKKGHGAEELLQLAVPSEVRLWTEDEDSHSIWQLEAHGKTVISYATRTAGATVIKSTMQVFGGSIAVLFALGFLIRRDRLVSGVGKQAS